MSVLDPAATAIRLFDAKRNLHFFPIRHHSPACALHLREALRAIEHAMLAFDGTRRMEITRMLASGDAVAVEADAIWGDKRTKACVFLTFNSDGMIVSDHSYGSDPSGASSH